MDSERRLVEEVWRACGPLLSTFLLAGYGREESVKCRSFCVTARDDLGPSGLRTVKAYSGAESDLPSGREPLVFAAVLWELFKGTDGPEVLLYHREVLESLGREDTAEARQFIGRALAKYTDMTIVEVRPPAHGPRLSADPVAITRMHPVVELRTVTARAGDDAAFRLVFGASFAAGLSSGGLFGAVWEDMTSGAGGTGG